MNCQERSGFLFAHDCDRPSENRCQECRRNICSQHTRGASLCVSCYRKQVGAKGDRPGTAARRNDPYWLAYDSYDDYHYYDSRDMRVFDRAEDGTIVDEFEGDFDAS